MGAPQWALDDITATHDFEVEEENAEAVEAFLRVSNQWNVIAGMNGFVYQGLKHEAIIPTFKLLYPDKAADIFKQVQLIERGALEELNKSA